MRPLTLICIGWAVAITIYIAVIAVSLTVIYFVIKAVLDVGLREILTNIWCGPLGC